MKLMGSCAASVTNDHFLTQAFECLSSPGLSLTPRYHEHACVVCCVRCVCISMNSRNK